MSALMTVAEGRRDRSARSTEKRGLAPSAGVGRYFSWNQASAAVLSGAASRFCCCDGLSNAQLVTG